MTQRPKVCIDRVLPRDLMRFQPTLRRGGRVRAISPRGKSWINGSTLSVRFLGGSPAEQDVAREQASWWAQHANIRFEFSSASEAEIRVAFNPDECAWSFIGTDALSIPLDQPTMNLGFVDGGIAAHEFGHVLGLAHEHRNPTGGIHWNEARVIRDLSGPPNSWTEAQIRHYVLRKYSADQLNGTDFDPDSIMLYFFPAAWTLNGIGTKANEVLSAIDKAFIAGAKMYPGVGARAPTGTELKVNAEKRTPASIGKAGEEDLYTFAASKDGRYVIDTSGPTDIVMKLFGPGSPTALIAEDDDSGPGLNARIAADLVAGEYFVQVRHYNKPSGTGEYSIKVRRL